MDPSSDQQQYSGLIQDSQRLLELTKILNLDDYDKMLCDVYATIYPFVDDFKRLQIHVNQLQKICCSYGLDYGSFDHSIFRKMQVLACHLATLPEAVDAYCFLKSQLFLEQNDFLDEVITKVGGAKTTDCASEAKIERMMRTVLQIRDNYDVFL